MNVDAIKILVAWRGVIRDWAARLTCVGGLGFKDSGGCAPAAARAVKRQPMR